MACWAGKNDRLAIFASKLQRKESKQAKRSNNSTQLLLLKKDDSNSDSDESVHTLEVPIPCKQSAKSVKFNAFDPKGIIDGGLVQ